MTGFSLCPRQNILSICSLWYSGGWYVLNQGGVRDGRVEGHGPLAAQLCASCSMWNNVASQALMGGPWGTPRAAPPLWCEGCQIRRAGNWFEFFIWCHIRRIKFWFRIFGVLYVEPDFCFRFYLFCIFEGLIHSSPGGSF
jgi:hypothetical protein